MTSLQIGIKPINIEDVLINNKIKYNTNNHWINKIKPVDYEDIIAMMHTKYWIDCFRDTYAVININASELSWMRECAKIGETTIKFSHLFDDEMEAFLKKYSHLDTVLASRKHFIRSENVSLKNGMHGVGPYSNIKNVVESLVTSTGGHSPICLKSTGPDMVSHLKLYLIPWIEIDSDREFRVFVHKNKITAISQQNLYRANDTLDKLDVSSRTSLIQLWINTIHEYFNRIVIKRVTHIDSYTMDFALIGDRNDPYFIEVNCFGKEYAAGSALVGWLQDEDILYGSSGDDVIHFRYTTATATIVDKMNL